MVLVRKSEVWNFFYVNKEEGTVCCKVCLKIFGGTCYSSSNLKRHVVSKHPAQWRWWRLSCSDITKTGKDNAEMSSEAPSLPRTQKLQSLLHSDTDEGGTKVSEEWLKDTDINSISSYNLNKKRNFTKRAKPKQTDHKNHKHSNKEKQFQDVYDSFGVYVATKIRELRNTKTKVNVQQLITTILWQAEYGLFNNFEAVKKIIMNSMEPTPRNEVPQANIIISYGNEQNDTELPTEQNYTKLPTEQNYTDLQTEQNYTEVQPEQNYTALQTEKNYTELQTEQNYTELQTEQNPFSGTAEQQQLQDMLIFKNITGV